MVRGVALALTALTVLAALAVAAAAQCTYDDPAGNHFDLSGMTKTGSGYYSAMDGNSQEYDINICAPVAGCSTFSSAAVCQKDSHGNQHDAGNTPGTFSQGTASPGQGFSLAYTGGESCGSVSRSFTIKFVCDKTAGVGAPQTVTESPTCTYQTIWNTMYACPGVTPPPGPGGDFGIGGWGFIIFYLVGLLLYCVIGVLIQKFRFQKAGKEMMPNFTFWASLPGLIKDGLKFVGHKTCCKRRAGYQSSV